MLGGYLDRDSCRLQLRYHFSGSAPRNFSMGVYIAAEDRFDLYRSRME